MGTNSFNTFMKLISTNLLSSNLWKKIPGNCQFLLMSAFFLANHGKASNFSYTFQWFISSYQILIT